MQAVVAVVALLLMAGGCSESAAQLDQPYKNSTEGFEIRPPRGWIVNESMGALVFFLNSEPDMYDDFPFTANINVVSEPVQDLKLEAYITQELALVWMLVPDYRILGSTYANINGLEVYFYEHTFTVAGIPTRGRQMIYVGKSKAFTITATALDAKWNEYSDVFNASLRSFRR